MPELLTSDFETRRRPAALAPDGRWGDPNPVRAAIDQGHLDVDATQVGPIHGPADPRPLSL
jgi:hypothetical protein